MRIIALALILILAATISSAQEQSESRTYYTRALCKPFTQAAALMSQYNETVLFTGNLLTFPAQGAEPAIGKILFATNQDTGTYSIIQLFPDGMACLIGSGNDFEPYVRD